MNQFIHRNTNTALVTLELQATDTPVPSREIPGIPEKQLGLS